MLIYIAIIITLIFITQAVRVIQNGISLYRQNKVIEKELSRFDDISNDDLSIQREAYRLIVKELRNKNGDSDNGTKMPIL